ncbi:unnamed protein product [Caenorhabditis auriculariae]|uniref:Uncharacterized protein n=1 Tax=Caenorhabditis auriculariae TaxID=2777116 RepID=A0A8S1GV13_9PELO|nr:unnamed protein product [Caenorhabditis auriculariae]
MIAARPLGSRLFQLAEALLPSLRLLNEKPLWHCIIVVSFAVVVKPRANCVFGAAQNIPNNSRPLQFQFPKSFSAIRPQGPLVMYLELFIETPEMLASHLDYKRARLILGEEVGNLAEMVTMNTPVWMPPESTGGLSCNCQYPIGLVIFLVFTILSLVVCICVCCFDITKCHLCKRKKPRFSGLHKPFDPRFIDTSKFVDRKFSLDPRLLEYSQLLHSGSLSSSQSRSIDVCSNGMYSTDTSLVTTV